MQVEAQYIAPLLLWKKHDDQGQSNCHQNPFSNDLQGLLADLPDLALIFDLF
jgi:hypothetical protein